MAGQTLHDIDSLLPLENRGGEMIIVQTDLFPALVVCTRSKRVRFLAGLQDWGLEGLQALAVPTEHGIEVLSADSNSASHVFDGARQSEAWMLGWFHGAAGWDRLVYGQPCHWRGHHPERPYPHIDVPWLIVLQRRAETVALERDRLSIGFAEDAGSIVLMPLFGLDIPSEDSTAGWARELPQEVTGRCRRWARHSRRIPIRCREEFHIDDKRDTVRIEQSFDYLHIDDDWQTPPEFVAPYPPFVTLAAKKEFPIELEEPPGEEIATAAGPLAFRVGVQSASYTLYGLLRYVDNDEVATGAPTDDAAERAIERLRKRINRNPRVALNTSGGFTRGLALALYSCERTLPYLTAEQQASVLELTDEIIARLLDPSHYMPSIRYPQAPNVEPVGEAICQQTRDAYKVVQANFLGLWAAFDRRGDRERLHRAWPLIRRWFHLPFQTQWLTALPVRWEGLDMARALFDGTIGFARIAAALGKEEDYTFTSYLFAKVCAGWFALEQMAGYQREHAPWLINTEAEHLIWHPCRINGYVAIANDHLLPNDDPKIDSRGWAGAFGRHTPNTARFWRDHLNARARAVLDEMLPRCRPDWAAAGAPAVMRAYVLGESAAKLQSYEEPHRAAEQKAKGNPIRRRTYRLFQSTPLLRDIATIEAGAGISERPVIEKGAAMNAFREGAGATATRIEQGPIPCRISVAEECGGWPLLYWPGIRTPQKPHPVLHPSLDLLPFGHIKTGPPGERGFLESEIVDINWCTSMFVHHASDTRYEIEPGAIRFEERESGAVAVLWSIPEPTNAIIQYWEHDPGRIDPGVRIVRDEEFGTKHCVVLHPPNRDGINWFRVLSFTETGQVYRTRTAIRMPTGRINWALDRPAYVSRRFPFKQYKFARDRETWLAAYRGEPVKWQKFAPPSELTDGKGIRPNVEPWIRHAEPDPKYVHWVAIDLGQPRPIDEVVIVFDPGWVSAGYRAEVSAVNSKWSDSFAEIDGPVWKARVVEENHNVRADVHHKFPPRKARWMRVVFTHPAPVGHTANRIALWEIEVRGPVEETALERPTDKENGTGESRRYDER